MRSHTVVETPVGPVTLVDQDGLLAGLHLHEERHLPAAATFGARDDAVLPQVRELLEGYFTGDIRQFDVPLAPVGTPFQSTVWAALREIPYGSTCTYGELAAAIGRPTASRAVGAANGRNPISIIVPCHRVIGSTGTLTGYAGGLARKSYLLALERGELTL
jgi:methylated-DNA-[protein]-cysteine S-methyltransferase